MMRGTDRIPTTSSSRVARGLLAAAFALSISACGGEGTGGADGADTVDAAGDREAASAEPSVLFQQPQDGDTVSSPVNITFGSENIRVAAVPDTVDTPREGVIHYHLGLDTDCLAPGTTIPSADPWIHFGDGSNQIEMQLAPGQHRLTVQAGNDKHVTLSGDGMCRTISVTVTEGGQGG